MKIPTLNMHEYSTNPASFVRQLAHACHDIGFFYLKNHGISSELTNELLALSQQFFNLPQAEKDNINISRSPHYRGYGKLEAEITQGIPDYKETYDLGLERQPDDNLFEKPYLTLMGPNQWPQSSEIDQAHFKSIILAYIDNMQQLGHEIMQALSLALDSQSDNLVHQFSPAASDAYAMLRLLHYPPTQENSLGVGPHVDSGWLILLLQDDVGGLQVQTRQGVWIDVPPIADTLVVNLGEMLQLASNGRFKATMHRVMNASGKRRLSAPFFFEPNLSTIVPQDTIPPTCYGQRMLEVFKRSFPR